jgi:hypothetical protein
MGGSRGQARALVRYSLALWVFAVPFVGNSVASAAPSSVTPITPIVECVAVNSSGGYTAVLGYSNPSSTSVTIPHGASNKLTPNKYDGDQPTTFLPGRQRGVFSVTVDHSNVKWRLQSLTLDLDEGVTPCPPSTQMPEQGNGTGIAVGLLAGAVVGVFMIRRSQRRLGADAAASSPSSTHPTGSEADDA